MYIRKEVVKRRFSRGRGDPGYLQRSLRLVMKALFPTPRTCTVWNELDMMMVVGRKAVGKKSNMESSTFEGGSGSMTSIIKGSGNIRI